MAREIHVIDSHTAGEPTRVVVAGGPPLDRDSMHECMEQFRDQYDDYRKAIVGEPRGNDVLVGALLCESNDPSCDAGVIFFNNVGFLGMCGHGMIGLITTLQHLGRVKSDLMTLETPVGNVKVKLNEDKTVSVSNVPSYRKAMDVKILAEGVGTVIGDVAYGGNWFFLAREPDFDLTGTSIDRLQEYAIAIRTAVNEAGFPEVDHIELFGEPSVEESDSKNFVLCPGLQYDRSPCGTGTSAKLACLAAEEKLDPGDSWVQEGILGTCFHASYQWNDQEQGIVLPTITGRAFIMSDSKLLLNDEDPFQWGIG